MVTPRAMKKVRSEDYRSITVAQSQKKAAPEDGFFGSCDAQCP
jgi:hypothetical protein